MHAVRSFLFVALLGLLSTAVARTDPFHPPRHGDHLSRPSVHRPLSRSPRALLRARQAVARPPSEALAAQRAADERARVQRLEKARRAVASIGDEVGRRAERVRRAVGGAKEGATAREEAHALHDILFRLLQMLSSSSAFVHTSTGPASTGNNPVVALAARPAEAVAARPSASPLPLPSGITLSRRSFPASAPPSPPAALHALVALLSTRVAAPLADVLPALPAAEREAVRALLAEVGDEVRMLAASAGEGPVRFEGERTGLVTLEEMLERVGGNETRV
ncbi:hypothetical protein JCM3770_006623 [Rhodotorula araucariae]